MFDSWQQARVSLNRIAELLATETTVPPPVDGVEPTHLDGLVELRNVAFRYPTAAFTTRCVRCRW